MNASKHPELLILVPGHYITTGGLWSSPVDDLRFEFDAGSDGFCLYGLDAPGYLPSGGAAVIVDRGQRVAFELVAVVRGSQSGVMV